MQTVVGIIQGLASRSPITIFDEPTTGLDAAHRELFYSLLLEDYGEYPRTIILSTHLVEEVTHIIEDVIIIKKEDWLFNHQWKSCYNKVILFQEKR